MKQHVQSENGGYTLSDNVIVRPGESTTPITASRGQWMTAATTELSDRLRESKSVVDRPSDYSKAPSLTNIEDVRTLSAKDIEDNWESVRNIIHAGRIF